nr:hypothetical protein [Tanacetum cinerariifolium]
MGRARIAQSSALPPVADELASPIRDVSQGEACPTFSGLEAKQDMANIIKTSTLPGDSTPRVTSLAADEGNMQQKLDELTALCTSLRRQQTELVSKFETQELEITRLKARIKLLEDKDGGVAEPSGEDAPIKGRRLDEGEEAAERGVDSVAVGKIRAAVRIVGLAVETTPLPVGILTVAVATSAAIHDFIPIGSKEEAERFKRKWIRFEQESVKKLKTSEEVKETEEVHEEKVKEMI